MPHRVSSHRISRAGLGILLIVGCLFFCGLFILLSSSWIIRKFGNGVTAAAIAWLLSLPLDGVDPVFVNSFLRNILPPSLLLTTCYVFLLYSFSRTLFGIARVHEQEGRKEGHLAKWWRYADRHAKTGTALLIAIACCAFLASFAVVQQRHEMLSWLLAPGQEDSRFFETWYKSVHPEDVVFSRKNNLILIELESIEETFNNEKLMGEKLMPKLSALRNEYLSFYGYKPVNGTDWTVAALTGFTLGLPLHKPDGIQGNVLGNSFLPSAHSILSVFEKNGYRLFFMLGTNGRFAGQNAMFSTHAPSTKIIDFTWFREHASPDELQRKRVGGEEERFVEGKSRRVFDATVFDAAKRQLVSMPTDKPFVFVMQTMDTHTNLCESDRTAQKYNDMRDCIISADAMAYDFARWAMAQPFASHTTIVLMGDHPIMQDSFGDISLPESKWERETYNVFINPVPVLKPHDQHRVFASFDMAPTLLEAVGARLPDGRFGIGTSLFHTQTKTLLETTGIEYYEQEMKKGSALYRSFHKER
ncbi:MAG: sulfatase-like hydrolase/transferase [Burkholderiaceae bacterium]|jgi:phosphoglycerol transferase|nr:sulfatase-like hydrolase/transferase [Burkholderiaceae bacterium]